MALEASKFQEEEDRRKRESKQTGDTDDDLAKAIKLSQEEEERRRRELEESNAQSLFDDDPIGQNQPQPTGFNQGYQQGNQVDFFANPIDQNQMNQMQAQPTGFINQAYTGFQPNQQTGFQPNYSAFNMQPTGMNMDPYGQQQQVQSFQPQPTGFNPYAQQQQQQQQQTEPSPQPGSNNPWATNQAQQSNLQPMKTGSNNPFAQVSQPQGGGHSFSPMSAVPEQKTLSNFNQPQHQPQPVPQQQMSFTQPQTQINDNTPKKPMTEHESRLNALLASGDGMDTFGNTGELRIPAQHTAPGHFMNSAGSGAARLTSEATGNNPFMRQQFTGMPNINYGGQQGVNGQSNPYGGQQQQQHPAQGQDLIQF